MPKWGVSSTVSLLRGERGVGGFVEVEEQKPLIAT